MVTRVLTDADGWVHTVIYQDAPKRWVPRDNTLVVGPLPAPPPLLFRLPDGTFAAPHDDDVAWLRYRLAGYTDEDALELALQRDVSRLPDLPATDRTAARVAAQTRLARASATVRTRLQRGSP